MSLKLLSQVYLYVMAASLLPALLLWGRVKASRLRSLPFFIISVLAMDITALLRRKNHLRNDWIKYIEHPLVYLFILYLFTQILQRPRLRQMAVALMALYAVIFLIDGLVYHHTYQRVYTRSYLTGALAVIVCALAFYYELLSSDRVLVFYRQPEFWVSTGILLFYLGTLPFHLNWNVSSVRFIRAYTNTKSVIYYLIFCQYILFSIGFLCLKPNKTPGSSLSPPH